MCPILPIERDWIIDIADLFSPFVRPFLLWPCLLSHFLINSFYQFACQVNKWGYRWPDWCHLCVSHRLGQDPLTEPAEWLPRLHQHVRTDTATNNERSVFTFSVPYWYFLCLCVSECFWLISVIQVRLPYQNHSLRRILWDVQRWVFSPKSGVTDLGLQPHSTLHLNNLVVIKQVCMRFWHIYLCIYAYDDVSVFPLWCVQVLLWT